ncbi:hypothetical protein CBL_05209 [Carabus blaptoides fortunei]
MITPTGPIRFVSIYKPSRNPLDTNDLTQLLNSGIPTIIAGNLNSKHTSWNSRIINTSGRTLRKYADTEQLAVHGPDEPTYFHHAGFRPDVLDILIAKNITIPIELGTVTELHSDHNPVLVYMNNPTARNDNIIRQKTDWTKYTQHVNDNIICNYQIKNINDLEQAVDSLTTCIKSAVQISTQTWTSPNTRADLPPNIRQLIQERYRARRAWQRIYDLSARSDMYRLAHDIKKAVREHQDQTWTDKVASLTTRDNSVWKMIRALNAKKISTPPIHGPNGMMLKTTRPNGCKKPPTTWKNGIENGESARANRNIQPGHPVERHRQISWPDLRQTAKLNSTYKNNNSKSKSSNGKTLPTHKQKKQNELEQQNPTTQDHNSANLNIRCSHMGIQPQANTHALQVVQIKFLRMATDSPWYLRNYQIHRDLNIEDLSENIRNQAIKFMNSCNNHSHDEVKLASCHEKDRMTKYHKPSIILNQS